jgi:hypothetical protein
MPKSLKNVILLLLLAAIIALLSFSGCSSSYTPSTMPWTGITPENLTQQQWQDIVKVALEYFEHLETYKVGISLSISTDAAGGTNNWTRSQNTWIMGAVNATKGDAEATKSVSMAMVGLGQTGESQSSAYETYLKDNFIYVSLTDSSGGTKWIKMKNSDELGAVFGYDSTNIQIAPLDLPANIEYTNTDQVDNVDCYVLNITPNKEELANWFNQQDTGFGKADWQNIVNDANAFKNFSCTCYVAKDTYWVTKIDLVAVVELTPEQVQVTSMGYEKITLTFNMNMVLYDHNVSYDISLPNGADTAIEHSSDIFLN